jgi:hypothetical protein
VKMSDEQRRTRRNADDNQSSVIIDRRTNDGGKSFFSFSYSLFTLITIIEILLSRSTHATKAKHKQNINFFFVVCICCFYSCFILLSLSVSLLPSSCLIYSHIHMMPSLCDYHYSLSLLVRSLLKEKKHL